MNRIVTEKSSSIRRVAFKALAENWNLIAFAMLVYFVLTNLLGAIIDNITDATFTYSLPENTMLGNEMEFGFASSLYDLLLTGAFTLGLASFCMAFARYKRIEYSRLFDGFSNYGQSLCLYILILVKITLWSFLFIVPGIVAAINYSQAFFIMQDNPQLSANQCIEESIRMMRGNKGKYFCFILSYIGWGIVAGVTSGLVSSVIARLTDNNIVTLLLGIFSFFPYAYLYSYIQVGLVAFYDVMSNKLVIEE